MNKKITNKKVGEKASSISYSGKVKIQLTRKGKVYKTLTGKNSGTSEFFRLIANCIAGVDLTDKMPFYIHLFDAEGNSACSVNIPANSRVPKLSSDKTGYEIIFEFLIPYNQLTGDASKVKLFNGLNYSNDNVLAEMTLVNADGETITISADDGSTVLITWVMYIGNASND